MCGTFWRGRDVLVVVDGDGDAVADGDDGNGDGEICITMMARQKERMLPGLYCCCFETEWYVYWQQTIELLH